jgi:hypothetical protein
MEMTDIIDTVSHHDKAIEPETKSEARVFFRINSSMTENIRMNHATRK